MTAESTPADPHARPDEEHAPNTWLNGLVGGAAIVLLVFLPFSTVLGGAIAGYLEGGTLADGALVGTIAGMAALLPVLAFAWLLAVVLGLFAPMGVALAAAVAVVAFLGLAYVVGLAVVGGILGVYVREAVAA